MLLPSNVPFLWLWWPLWNEDFNINKTTRAIQIHLTFLTYVSDIST